MRRCFDILTATLIIVCCSTLSIAQSNSSALSFTPLPVESIKPALTNPTTTKVVSSLLPESPEATKIPQGSDSGRITKFTPDAELEPEQRQRQRPNFIKALNEMQWQDWTAIAGFLFGIITLIAYLDQRRSNKSQAQMHEFVERQLNRDISKDEINALSSQRAELEEQVRKHIPSLARTAVLKEQLEAHAAAVAHHFSEWRRLEDELQQSPTSHAIDPAIEEIIIDRIVPKFEHQEKVDAVRNKIVIYSVAVAVFNAIFFYPVNMLFSMIIIWPLLRDVGSFLRLTGRATGIIGFLFSKTDEDKISVETDLMIASNNENTEPNNRAIDAHD